MPFFLFSLIRFCYRSFVATMLLVLFAWRAPGQGVPIDANIRKTTLVFSTKDTQQLKMDVYCEQDVRIKRACVVFVFGGGFFAGERDATYYNGYFNTLVHNHYTVVSIDYRLGLKHTKKPSALHTKPLRNAIDTAVTDLYDATAYLLQHGSSMGIDTSYIILSGSSAGAITVLQADWNKRNHTALTRPLPESFQYAGVIAFAGAILSFQGAPSYKMAPAPTMLFHGTVDKVVVYNKIRFFNKGFFGSNYLASRFKKWKYPYYFRRVQGMGHEVAGTPMKNNLDEILWFMDNYVFKKKQYLLEVDFDDLQKMRTYPSM